MFGLLEGTMRRRWPVLVAGTVVNLALCSSAHAIVPPSTSLQATPLDMSALGWAVYTILVTSLTIIGLAVAALVVGLLKAAARRDGGAYRFNRPLEEHPVLSRRGSGNGWRKHGGR